MSEQVLRNRQGERLDAALSETGGPDLVVLGHGVTANRDRKWALQLAEGLEVAGLSALRFSFSGNGDSGGHFEESTVSKEVEDLGAVLDAFSDRRLSYVGHGMGAAVGVLRAAQDSRIRRLVSLGGMVELAAFARRHFGDLVPGQDLMWNEADCPLSLAFMDDMDRLDSLLPQAATLELPWLLVHGTADRVVPPADSRAAAAQGGSTTLVEIAGADHVFSGESGPKMVSCVVDWLLRTPPA